MQTNHSIPVQMNHSIPVQTNHSIPVLDHESRITDHIPCLTLVELDGCNVEEVLTGTPYPDTIVVQQLPDLIAGAARQSW